jgi:hypothetical protein
MELESLFEWNLNLHFDGTCIFILMELESSPQIKTKKLEYNALREFVGAELFHAN